MQLLRQRCDSCRLSSNGSVAISLSDIPASRYHRWSIG